MSSSGTIISGSRFHERDDRLPDVLRKMRPDSDNGGDVWANRWGVQIVGTTPGTTPLVRTFRIGVIGLGNAVFLG